MCCVFLCKQKTAYEVLIIDWRSDVCSADLLGRRDDIRRRTAGDARPRRIDTYLGALLERDADQLANDLAWLDRLIESERNQALSQEEQQCPPESALPSQAWATAPAPWFRASATTRKPLRAIACPASCHSCADDTPSVTPNSSPPS